MVLILNMGAINVTVAYFSIINRAKILCQE